MDLKAHLGVLQMISKHAAAQKGAARGGHRAQAQRTRQAPLQVLQLPHGGLGQLQDVLRPLVEQAASVRQGDLAGPALHEGDAPVPVPAV